MLGSIARNHGDHLGSTPRHTRISVQFELSRSIDSAAREVQAGINAARATLPSGMPNPPTYRKAESADAPVMILQLSSDLLGRERMYDIASTMLQQRIAQVEGVGQIELAGSSLPAVRVQLDTQQMDKLGIVAEQVRTTIVKTMSTGPGRARHRRAAVADRRQRPGARGRRLAAGGGLPQRCAGPALQDIATVIDSVYDVRNAGYADGKPAVLLTVATAGANILETSRGSGR